MAGTGTHAADGLAGKVALVVGGGWRGPDDYAIGIGGAICQHLARDGVRLAVLDIADANAERTLAPILKEGGDAFKIVADTAADADCKRAVDEVIARYGQLDILINNVGAGAAPGCEPGSDEEFDRLMAVNFRGEVLMAKHAAPHMPRGRCDRERGLGIRRGRPDPRRVRGQQACRVLGPDAAIRSCLVFAVQMQGVAITTVEGLTPDGGGLSDVQEAFRAEHGLQCGFCTPGFVVSATAFLAEHPDPSADQIRDGLSGNLCRCTGYQGIVRAVQAAVRARQEARHG